MTSAQHSRKSCDLQHIVVFHHRHQLFSLQFYSVIQVESATPRLHVIFTTVPGRISALTVNASETVCAIKEKLWEKTKIPVDQQKFIFKGSAFENDLTLADYNVEDESTIHLVHPIPLRRSHTATDSDMPDPNPSDNNDAEQVRLREFGLRY